MSMWPFKTKNQVKAAAQPRSERGTFSAGVPSPAYQIRQADAELQVVNSQMSQFNTMLDFMDKYNRKIDEKVEEKLAEYEQGGGGEDDTMKQLMPLLIAFLMKGNNGGSAPSYAPPSVENIPPAGAVTTPQPAADNVGFDLLKRAATTPPAMIKTALKLGGFKELENRGMGREEFKQAVTNIYKAIGGKDEN